MPPTNPAVADERKHQEEIDRCIETVCLDIGTLGKRHNAANANQKKYKADLKRRIQKLQCYVQQIKTKEANARETFVCDPSQALTSPCNTYNQATVQPPPCYQETPPGLSAATTSPQPVTTLGGTGIIIPSVSSVLVLVILGVILAICYKRCSRSPPTQGENPQAAENPDSNSQNHRILGIGRALQSPWCPTRVRRTGHTGDPWLFEPSTGHNTPGGA